MVVGYLAAQMAREGSPRLNLRSKIVVKRGAEILEGPYPKHFTDFVGQERAVLQVMAAVTSAIERDASLDHVLFASGLPGIGKTSLARLTASLLDVGFIELGGKVTDVDAAAALKEMQDGDVLFLDEIHRLVQGGKASAEWLLTLLHDGELHTPQGVVQAPQITVIAATTDKEKLPQTILDRFRIQPALDAYTMAEAVKIGTLHAERLGFGGRHLPMPTSTVWLENVARASDNNPRRISNLLTTLRDVAITNRGEDGIPTILGVDGYDLTIPLEWAGITADGLTDSMQDYLTMLFINGGTAGVATIKAGINLEDLKHTERALIQRGLVVVTGSGRRLTEYGAERAEQVAQAQLAAVQKRESDSQNPKENQ